MLCDPAFTRLFLRRYWGELLVGASVGLALGAATLWLVNGLGVLDGLRGLGEVFQGRGLQLHGGAVLPVWALLGVVLAVRVSQEGFRGGLNAYGWVALASLLAGAANGVLELMDATGSAGRSAQDGIVVGLLLVAGLSLVLTLAASAVLSLIFRDRKG
jgi:hypothetical protein